MNVLMTADTMGGVFTYALELALALGRHGANVALATKGGFLSDDQWGQAHRVPGLEVFESADRLEWMQDPWEDVARSSGWLLELARRLRPDVVHLNDYAHGALPFEAPVLVVGHSCVCSWFAAVRRSAPPRSFDRYRLEVARGLAGADLVVAPTRWMLSELDRHYGPLRRTCVIPNGRSPAQFRPGEKEDLVLCAGRPWDEAKNVAALDDVAGGLPWPVLVAGELEGPDRLRDGARLSILRHARPLGHLPPDALACFFARAGVYAMPARYEPFGLSVLEAAIAGCALVLGDIPSLREVWEGAALFVDPESPELLRTVLAGLVDRPDVRAHLGSLSRARGLALSPERMAVAYLDAYRMLVTEHRDAQGDEGGGSRRWL
jgi:glycosyltransferase involved in cell wall biosynthesis